MTDSKFTLTPATGTLFIGRKALLDELSRELGNSNSHVGFCLYGKRRVGKTSILMELKQMFEHKKDTIIAYLSLYDLIDLSSQTFAEELTSTILSAYQKKGILPLKIQIKKLLEAPIEIVSELLKNTKMEATVLEHIKILLENKRNQKISSEQIRHAFNLAQVMANATSTKCVLMLDEFPEILKIENGLQIVKMLRTQYELQTRTALVISGSIRKTLEAVSLLESSPFYKQLVAMHIKPFTKEETMDFLSEYKIKLKETDMDRLYQLTGGIPFYLQFIGRATHYSNNLEEAIKNFITEEGDLYFKEEFEKLNETERAIVIALCEKNKNLTEISTELKEPTTTIGRYISILLEQDIVAKESRGIYFFYVKTPEIGFQN